MLKETPHMEGRVLPSLQIVSRRMTKKHGLKAKNNRQQRHIRPGTRSYSKNEQQKTKATRKTACSLLPLKKSGVKEALLAKNDK